MPDKFKFLVFKSREEMIETASCQIANAVRSAVLERGRASLMLSGGCSPRPVYEALSGMDLPWEKVTVGLVDDRWINAEEAGSNEAFLKNTLFKGKAKVATLIGLKTNHANPTVGLETCEKNLAAIPQPFDICVMGMGLDGHTASWFPNSKGLKIAMDVNNLKTVAAIDARGCRVAGDHPDRITLTLSAVMAAKEIILMIPGTGKADVFKASANKSVFDAPVKALRAAGDRLTVITDET